MVGKVLTVGAGAGANNGLVAGGETGNGARVGGTRGVYGLPDLSIWDGFDGAYVEDGGTVETKVLLSGRSWI